MRGSRLREQDGFIRESIYVFLTLLVVSAIVLDAVAAIQVGQTVKGDAHDAAVAAADAFVQTSSNDAARTQAESVLTSRGDTLLGFSVDSRSGHAVYSVTAQRHAHTYVFHYLAKLPRIGDWVERTLNPKATRSSD
jgi:hypothetical protein